MLEFLQLAGGSTYVQLHLDEWRIVERNYTDSEKCMGSSIPFLSKWVEKEEALNEIPHSFSATFYRTASVKFDPRDQFL